MLEQSRLLQSLNRNIFRLLNAYLIRGGEEPLPDEEMEFLEEFHGGDVEVNVLPLHPGAKITITGRDNKPTTLARSKVRPVPVRDSDFRDLSNNILNSGIPWLFLQYKYRFMFPSTRRSSVPFAWIPPPQLPAEQKDITALAKVEVGRLFDDLKHRITRNKLLDRSVVYARYRRGRHNDTFTDDIEYVGNFSAFLDTSFVWVYQGFTTEIQIRSACSRTVAKYQEAKGIADDQYHQEMVKYGQAKRLHEWKLFQLAVEHFDKVCWPKGASKFFMENARYSDVISPTVLPYYHGQKPDDKLSKANFDPDIIEAEEADTPGDRRGWKIPGANSTRPARALSF